ncbi:hypothetical protein BC332_12921 [Capsicum chinense]|nr:hypothetical protein BC332_12921 [Capsicum chinense]
MVSKPIFSKKHEGLSIKTDVLVALVRHYPYFAGVEFSDDESLLSLMAEEPSAFWSGTQLGFWQWLLSDFIHNMFILSYHDPNRGPGCDEHSRTRRTGMPSVYLAIWNPPLTRRGSLQPEYAARVGVPESDTPHDT